MSAVVGRDRELGEIVAFLELAAEGARVLLLEGEAGIGKTTVWRTSLEIARARGYRVLSCAAARSEAQLALTTVRDLVGDAFEEVGDELPSPQRRALGVALLREEPTGRPPDQAAVSVAFLNTLRLLASSTPTLVAVDDVQWLDPASAGTLSYVIRRLGDEPLAALLARRAGEEPGPLALDLGDERLAVLPVPPLTVGALARILRSRLGVSYPRPTQHRLHEASGGNPFFALELGRALERHGGKVEPGAELPVPVELGELVDARIRELPSATIEVLRAASALARPTVAQLAEATGIDVPAALVPAVDAGVVALQDDQVEFVHPLFASGVYVQLTRDEGQRLHRRLAAVVHDVEQRARHLALAIGAPDAEVADLLDEAARHAQHRGAPAVAAELAELAVRLTPADAPEERTRRRIMTTALHGMAGDFERERTVLLELKAEVSPGPQRAEVLTRLAITGGDRAANAALYDRALVEAAGERVLEAWIGHISGQNLRVLGELARGRARQRRAFELLRETDGPLFVNVLGGRILLDTFAGDAVADEVVSHSLELARGPEVPPWLDSPLRAVGSRCLFAGHVDEARGLFDEYEAKARRFGDDNLAGDLLVHRVQLECAAGRLDTAEALAAEFVEYAAELGLLGLAPYATALVAAYRGRVREARAAGRTAVAEAEAANNVWMQLATASVLGFAELAPPNLPEAWSILGPAAARAEAVGIRELEGPSLYANAAEAAVGVGELARARELVAVLERHALTVDSPAALHGAARGAGLIAFLSGEVDDAIASFERGLAEDERAPLPFERARTLLALGSAQRRAKQRRAARDSLEQALDLFEQIGTAQWPHRVRAELARIGGRRAHVPGELTPTERRIAELVADGKTNKEVAAILVVADRTVESALTQIYRKLDVRSRTELARKLAHV